MKKYCFITTLTPEKFLTPLRRRLFELYLIALKNQSYTNWFVLIIGEKNKTDSNFIYLSSEAQSKSDKLKVAYNFLSIMKDKPDYIIRLDDDDLISPHVLKYSSNLDFDCLSDKFHTYYDITTANISQQERSWLPNTIIHKFEHAMAPYGEQDIPLFMHDHSQAWHNYYSGKKVHYVGRKHPVYLRIISPTTITSRMDPQKSKIYSDFNKVEYEKYLRTFGKWRKFNSSDFKCYLDQLVTIWEEFSSSKIQIRKRSFFNFFR